LPNTTETDLKIRVDDVVRSSVEKPDLARSFTSIEHTCSYEIPRKAKMLVFLLHAPQALPRSLQGGASHYEAAAPDLNAMNPANETNPENNGAMAPPKTFGRDRSIGQTVTIRRGHTRDCLEL